MLQILAQCEKPHALGGRCSSLYAGKKQLCYRRDPTPMHGPLNAEVTLGASGLAPFLPTQLYSHSTEIACNRPRIRRYVFIPTCTCYKKWQERSWAASSHSLKPETSALQHTSSVIPKTKFKNE